MGYADEAALLFKIKADGSQAKAELSSVGSLVQKEVQSIGREFAGGAGRIGTFTASLGPAGLALGAVAGIAVSVGAGIAAATVKAVELGSRFNDLSLQTGLSVETLSGLESQLKQSGSSAESLGNAVLFMHKNLGQAAEGNKELKRTFAELGIKDVNAALHDTDGALRTVIGALGKITDEGNRDRLGVEALGRGYKDLRVFISDTGGDIDETLRKAREAGLIMSTEVAGNLDALGDKWDELSTKTRTFSADFLGIVAPEITKGLEDISSALTGSAVDWERWGLDAAISIGRIRGATEAMGKWLREGHLNPWKLGDMVEQGAEAGGMGALGTYMQGKADEPMRMLRGMRGGGSDVAPRGGGGGKKGGADKAAAARLKDIQADEKDLDEDFKREGEALERDYRRRLDNLAQFTAGEIDLLDKWIKEKRAIYDREEKEVSRSTKNADERKLREIQQKRTAAEDEYDRKRNAAEDKLEEGRRRADEANADKKLKLAQATARARISAIEQVADLGIKKESDAAAEIGKIQLDLHSKETARLKDRLEQAEVNSAEYRRLQGEVGAAEIEHAALVEEVAHRVVMAKKAEVEAERQRLESLRQMRAQARSEGIEIEKGFVQEAAREDPYRTRAERIATIRQLADLERQAEDVRNADQLAQIENEKRNNLERAKTEQDRVEALKLYDEQTENEMRQHQLRLGEITQGQKEDEEGQDPFKPFKALWSDFKKNAQNADDSISNSAAHMSQAIVGSFGAMEGALKQGIVAHLLYGESLGLALKKALAAQLANLSAEFTVQGIRHAAYALGSLAFGDFSGAAKHAAASAAFFAAAGLTGKLSSGLAKSAGMQGGGGAAGSAVASTDRQNGRNANPSDPNTIREARRGGSPDPLEQSRNQFAPAPIILHIESNTRNEPGTLTEHVVKVVSADPRVKVAVAEHVAENMERDYRGRLHNAIESGIITSYRDNGRLRDMLKQDIY